MRFKTSESTDFQQRAFSGWSRVNPSLRVSCSYNHEYECSLKLVYRLAYGSGAINGMWSEVFLPSQRATRSTYSRSNKPRIALDILLTWSLVTFCLVVDESSPSRAVRSVVSVVEALSYLDLFCYGHRASTSLDGKRVQKKANILRTANG
eukprot:1176829-Prorocentrum_minimum.AAC.1